MDSHRRAFLKTTAFAAAPLLFGANDRITYGLIGALLASRERNASLPQVPTLTELGVADYDGAGWCALFGPAKMPPELVAKLNDATRKVLAAEEFRAKLVEQGFDVWADSPQALGARVVKELALWGPVTKGIPQQ